MPGENAGKLSVRYNIVSTKAEQALNRLALKLKQVENYAKRQQKSISKAFKASQAAFAAFGVVAVGVLYSIIRSSSYASMYMDQFNMSLTRVSDSILEMTGLDKAIESLLLKFEAFADALSTDKLDEWKESLTTAEKIVILGSSRNF